MTKNYIKKRMLGAKEHMGATETKTAKEMTGKHWWSKMGEVKICKISNTNV